MRLEPHGWMRIEDGGLLWEYPWQVRNKQLPNAQPVALGTNRFLLSAGYFTGSAGVEIQQNGSNFTARSLWQSRAMKNKFTSRSSGKGTSTGWTRTS